MGLFATNTHVFNKTQESVLKALKGLLKNKLGISAFSQIEISKDSFHSMLEDPIYANKGNLYLITHIHGEWVSIVELNVNIDPPVYLYEYSSELSQRLDTYTFATYLHDSDVFFYNLNNKGQLLDGYNSDYQYFLTDPAKEKELIEQRHKPRAFNPILPKGKNVEELNQMLNRGYWNAVDNSDLDDEGCPKGDKYFIDEEERAIEVGKYLEIFNKESYPFIYWYHDLKKLRLEDCNMLYCQE